MANPYPGVQIHRDKLRIWFMWKGKQTFESLYLEPSPKNFQAAARLRQEISEKIKHNIFVYEDYFPDSIRAGESSVATFSQIADRWFKNLIDKSPATLYGYEKILNHYLLPVIGHLPIKHIKYSQLTELLAGLNVKPKTRNNIMTPIRQVFDLAYMDGEIEKNPALKLKSSKNQKEFPDPFTLNEAEKILSYLNDHYPSPLYNYFELAFFAGLRTSELIALKWQDVDWNEKLLRVKRAKVKQQLKETKTHVMRDVELNSRAIAVLKRQKELTFLSHEWIFLNPNTGQPFIDDRPVRRWAWTPTLKALGIRHRPAYNTRHTCATLMLMSGSNPAWAAKQLGHSIETFLRTYSRWIEGNDRGKELSKLEQMLGTKEAKK